MLSTIRSALTPSANQAEDKELSELAMDISPTAPDLLAYNSSPPPFSPFAESQEHFPTPAAHASNGNSAVMAEQHDPSMDLSSDQNSPSREQEATDDSLLGPVKASDPTSDSHHGASSLDGASDDHLQTPMEDAYARGALLPSAEPAQSTSKSQRTQWTPSPSADYAGLQPRTSSTPQPTNMVTATTGGNAPRSQKAEPFTSTSGTASGELEQSAQAATDDAETSASSKARPPKRKCEDDASEMETKYVKKQRSQSKKEEGSTGNVKQPGASKAKSPKKRGRAKKEDSSTGKVKQQAAAKDELPKKRDQAKKEESSTGNVKQQYAGQDETPKKRGRPKKEELSAQEVKSQLVSKENAPAKRGRPKKEAVPTQRPKEMQTMNKEKSDGFAKGAAVLKDQDREAKEKPKKIGRPGKGAEPAGAVEPTGVPAADTPKKRGRPKKGEEAAQGTEPQGSSNVEIAKKRGRPKATEQGETPKTRTPGKRGRPKKEQITPKGAKPVGIVKKKAGRK
ncbi:hypothetical protein HO133_004151 [Letharia lupina]|uniref:Uncharacterized protein n=1 Tax=Letharia lupina TaxID=560253 RepID=A0A8H6F8Y1_9LECA|nr:uncharacterized protein HO133_004151 [Letharia lupina]KAF6219682.1 hypothetical protein HO133_004151 [Letharia lupina]